MLWTYYVPGNSRGKGFPGPERSGESGLLLPGGELLVPSSFLQPISVPTASSVDFQNPTKTRTQPLFPPVATVLALTHLLSLDARDSQLSGLLFLPLATPFPHIQSVPHPAATVMPWKPSCGPHLMMPFTHSFFHPSIHPSTYSLIHPSIRPSIQPSVQPSIHLFIHLSILPSMCSSIIIHQLMSPAFISTLLCALRCMRHWGKCSGHTCPIPQFKKEKQPFPFWWDSRDCSSYQ